MIICRKITLNGFAISRKVTSMISKETTERTFASATTAKSNSFDLAKERTEFIDALPVVIEDLAKHPKFTELPITKDWIKKVLNGTLAGGKFSRGLTTVMSYKIVEKPENITEETVRLARSLGWCTELLQAYCVILDDIMDGSETRRGKPCWYRMEDVGISHALNDSILIYCALQQILRHNFEKSSIYVQMHQTFNEILFYTSIGQFLDVTGSGRPINYDLFTKQYYDDIVKHKASYYTFQLPISVGLMLANHLTEESQKNCEDISLELGKLFQIQVRDGDEDDYIDCFGDESLTGKKGTDIQEGKCSWLAVNALPRCNAKNRIVFTTCYGSIEPAHVERIKQLYVRLQIPELYKKEEQELHNKIVQRINTISSDVERELYQKVLDMTFARKK